MSKEWTGPTMHTAQAEVLVIRSLLPLPAAAFHRGRTFQCMSSLQKTALPLYTAAAQRLVVEALMVVDILVVVGTVVDLQSPMPPWREQIRVQSRMMICTAFITDPDACSPCMGST